MKTYLPLLNEFANGLSAAQNINIEITEYQTSLTPKYQGAPAYYEDATYITDTIKGAEQFIYFLERNGYTIKKEK